MTSQDENLHSGPVSGEDKANPFSLAPIDETNEQPNEWDLIIDGITGIK